MCPSNKDAQLTFLVKMQVRAHVTPALMSKLAAEFPASPNKERHGICWYFAQEISKRGIPICEHLFTNGLAGEDAKYTKFWNFDLRGQSKDSYGNDVFDFDLRSRLLTFNDADYMSITHVPGALEEVRNVVQILNDSQVSFTVNSKCGLHICAGLKKKKPKSLLGSAGSTAKAFDLETLQALSGLVTAAEPCITSMLAKHRAHSDHHKTPSMTHGLSTAETWRRMIKIQNTNNVQELVELMNPDNPTNGRNYAYNFAHLLRYTGSKKRDGEFSRGMIEFRQHEATLNPQEVTNWLQSVAGMVRLALKPDTLSRAKNWAVSAERGDFTMKNFLEKIGKAYLFDFYSQKPNRPYSKAYVDANGIRDPQPYRESSRFSIEPPSTVNNSLCRKLSRAFSCKRKAGGSRRSKDTSDSETRSTTQADASMWSTRANVGVRS